MSHKRRLKVKKSWIQWIRAASLFSVFAFFIFVPASNWYANYKIAYNQARLVALAEGPFLGTVYSILDWFFTFWDDPVTAATSNNGSLWAFTLLGVPFSDPLGLISEIINGVHFPLKYLIGGFIPFAVVLVFGRAFCAWLCPMTVLYGVTAKIRGLMLRFGFPLLVVELPERSRMFIFWIGMVLTHFLGAWVWHFVLPYISFTHEIFSIVIFSSFTVGIYFLIALLVLDIGLIPGQFCKSLCPTGWLLAALGEKRLARLKADEANCPTRCTRCQDVCPINLFPRKGELYSCHLCMKCVDNCPKHHIELKFGVPK